MTLQHAATLLGSIDALLACQEMLSVVCTLLPEDPYEYMMNHVVSGGSEIAACAGQNRPCRHHGNHGLIMSYSWYFVVLLTTSHNHRCHWQFKQDEAHEPECPHVG